MSNNKMEYSSTEEISNPHQPDVVFEEVSPTNHISVDDSEMPIVNHLGMNTNTHTEGAPPTKLEDEIKWADTDKVEGADSPAADKAEADEALLDKDGKPKRMFSAGIFSKEPWGVDPDYIFNMLERKNLETLNDTIGGIDGLSLVLQTHPERGINSDTVPKRQELYGTNALLRKEVPMFFWFLVDAFKDPIMQILCVCSVVGIILGMTLPNPHTGEVDTTTGWIEGTAIIISVLVVTMTQAVTNWTKAKKFEELEREQTVTQVQVFRDGREITIDSSEIVTGDLMVVEGGMMLSVDGIFVSGSNLKTNESAMTGEPDLIKKSTDKDPFFLSGTLIEEGEGKMMVVAVGMEAIQGRLKEATDEEQADTPLQEHLTDLADKVARVAFALAFLLISALCIKEGILISKGEREAEAATFLNYVIIAVAVIVMTIPEGLPLAVTIALAFSMKSMMVDDNCLVRVLASCETMGAATAVCSDKTGTLTTNVMSCAQGVVACEEFYIGGYGLRPRCDTDSTLIDRTDAKFRRLSEKAMNLFCEAIAFNSTAREQEIDGRVVWVGNKTEHGLLGFCNLVKKDYKAIRASVPESDQRQFPFNSKKKRMSTIVRRSGSSIVFVKGASEVILEDCSRFVNEKGDVVSIGEKERETFLAQLNDMANQGNRTIAVAYSDYNEAGFPEDEPDFDDYILLGVLGIQDPIREEVPKAVKDCKDAGVRVRMVTGDNINTAIAIAKKCGIYEENVWDLAMTGQEFREMYTNDKDKLLEIVPRLCVLARSSPQDKYILVSMLQELGEVVGVTGDGTNDAPALKLANVGFAMQIGTDIAKGASDMILIDNNFATVVNAIRWGRSVNDNIRKFIQYQLSINMGGCILTFVGPLASPTSKEALSPVQLLWLNLIMDSMAAIALATERPTDASLKRLPSYKQSNLISRRMSWFIIVHALFQTAIICLLLFHGHDFLKTVEGRKHCDLELTNETSFEYQYCNKICKNEGGKYYGHYCQQGREHSSIMFNTYIWFQVFNIFNARKLYGEHNIFEGFGRSKPLFAVILIIAIFQIFAVELFGSFLSTVSIPWDYWLICLGFASLELIVGVFVRFLPHQSQPPPQEILEYWERENKIRDKVGVPRIQIRKQ